MGPPTGRWKAEEKSSGRAVSAPRREWSIVDVIPPPSGITDVTPLPLPRSVLWSGNGASWVSNSIQKLSKLRTRTRTNTCPPTRPPMYPQMRQIAECKAIRDESVFQISHQFPMKTFGFYFRFLTESVTHLSQWQPEGEVHRYWQWPIFNILAKLFEKLLQFYS